METIILAAGKGSRMKETISKVLVDVEGKTANSHIGLIRKHIVHIDKYTDLFLSNVLIFLKTKNFYASHPRNLPLRNEGVFFRQPKHRLRRLLSAQRIPFEFGHTSDFSEK